MPSRVEAFALPAFDVLNKTLWLDSSHVAVLTDIGMHMYA